MTVFMAQDQHNTWVIKAAWGTRIPLLNQANEHGQNTSHSADRDVTHQLAEQGDQNSCVVNRFTTMALKMVLC